MDEDTIDRNKKPESETGDVSATEEAPMECEKSGERTGLDTDESRSQSENSVSDDVPNRDDFCREDPPKLKYYNEDERQEEINKYKKFKKVDGETYQKVNLFLRKRTYITAREWAISRLCADFKTPYGSEMTFIGEHLPELCPFMEEQYSPQAVNQARSSFKRKVRKSASTFLYGAMCGFFTHEELDDILFEANEVSKFFLEIEGTALELDEEIDIEDKISNIMKNLGMSARTILEKRMESKNEGDGTDKDDTEEPVVVSVEESSVPKKGDDPSSSSNSP